MTGADMSASVTALQNQTAPSESLRSDIAGNKNYDIASSVSQIMRGKNDCRGEVVDYVYFKREHYAVYLSGSQIVVAYSDDNQVADRQIATVSPLLPLRDHLTNIVKELPLSSARANYLAQIAEALRLGLENQIDAAKEIIADAVADAQCAQARIGRMIYLKWTAGLALIIATLLISIGGAYVQNRAGVHLLLMATGAGAIGSLLSIAIAIRNRTVAVDGNWRANAMDASVRLLIGIISAAVFFLILNSGLLTEVQIGSVKMSGENVQWEAVLVVGFVAGFLERLVPDLLANARSSPSTSVPPTSSSGVASPNGSNLGGV